MAIKGLRTAPQPFEARYIENKIDNPVDASVEILSILGLVENRNRVAKSIAAEFDSLSQCGRAGEAFIQLPRRIITLEGLIKVLDGIRYSYGRIRYHDTNVWNTLWTPGVNKNGYRAEELDNLTADGNGDFMPHARLAIHNPYFIKYQRDNPNPTKEQLLYFVGQPYDESDNGEPTQLEAIKKAASEYEAEGREGFEVTPLNAKAIVFIALMRRVMGEDMPLQWGAMRDATLPRRTMKSGSYIGCMFSDYYDDKAHLDGLNLDRSKGGVDLTEGVGLSVGPNNIERQAA
jgi:hypothetical protein